MNWETSSLIRPPSTGDVLRALVIAGEGATADVLVGAVHREQVAPGWQAQRSASGQRRLNDRIDTWRLGLGAAERRRFVASITAALERLVGLGIVSRQVERTPAGRQRVHYRTVP
jgi:hypothetical protein